MANLNLAPAEDLTSRQSPVIQAGALFLNAAGMVWREYLVRLPQEFVADDLKDPSIWRHVQSGGQKLVKHDRLYLVSYDELWVAEAIVGHADSTKAVLGKPRITSFPERFEALFQTDRYKVEWTGSGYCVVRKSDSRRVSNPTTTAALAERELIQIEGNGQ